MPANLFQINGLSSGVDTASLLDALRQYKMRPVALEQRKQDTYTIRQRVWQDINSRLLAVKTASDGLTKAGAFGGVKAVSADAAIASLTADATAAVGTVNLQIEKLAKARKVATNTFGDASEALGLSGDFTVNGKAVRITSDDTLASLAGKITALGAGASAAVVQVAPGQFRLTVSSTSTGLQDSLSLAQVSGDSLSMLGLIDSSGDSIRYSVIGPDGTSAQSSGFTSAVTDLDKLMGLAASVSGTFAVNGVSITYDTATDTLNSLASRINSAGASGVTASVVSVTEAGGKVTQRLQITDDSGAPTFSKDANGLLGMLGITQAATPSGNVLSDAQDAQFKLDGLLLTRPSNTVTDALTGVTLNLLAENKSTTLTFSRDTEAAAKSVNGFVTAYNDAVKAIRAQFTYTAGSATPALFGDSTLQQVQDELISTVTNAMQGLPEGFRTLADIGITLGADNTLSVNDATLNAALAKSPDSVAKMFTEFGSASHPDISFVHAPPTVVPSPEGYAVRITTPAQRAQVVGNTPGPAIGAETLTFSGALFPSGASVTLAAGNTLDQTIAQINDSAIGKSVEAYDAGGRLGLRSRDYGAAQSFTVVSDKSVGYSGIGSVPLSGTGVDVAGTIGGESATGKGRILTGSQNGGSVNGLALQVSATAPGEYGTVSFERGAAASAARLVGQLTDFSTGAIKQEQKTLQQRIDSSRQTVESATARVDAEIARLQAQFTRMESQLSRLRAQSAQLGQTISGLSGSSGGTKNG